MYKVDMIDNLFPQQNIQREITNVLALYLEKIVIASEQLYTLKDDYLQKTTIAITVVY